MRKLRFLGLRLKQKSIERKECLYYNEISGEKYDKLTRKNHCLIPRGNTEVRLRRMIGGNTTNLNDLRKCVIPGSATGTGRL